MEGTRDLILKMKIRNSKKLLHILRFESSSTLETNKMGRGEKENTVIVFLFSQNKVMLLNLASIDSLPSLSTEINLQVL